MGVVKLMIDDTQERSISIGKCDIGRLYVSSVWADFGQILHTEFPKNRTPPALRIPINGIWF